MYKLEIERGLSGDSKVPLPVGNFLENLKKDNTMWGCESVYADGKKTLSHVKWLISKFNEKQDKKQKAHEKKKPKYQHKYSRLIAGSGSSHVWIHIEGDDDRIAILRES